MLKLEDVSVFYDGIHALQGVSIDVPEGKIVSLIGANGAGKSTTLKSIVGLVRPASGSISWHGREISAAQTKDIVRRGIVLVPEGRRVFPNLTVEENLALGAYSRTDRSEVKKDREMVYDLFPRLRERINQSAGTLSGGEQQMLAVGRGLMTRPELFMLDEPSLGLAPLIVKMIFEIIREINRKGTTVLLVEQNAHAALEVADMGYVLETGSIILQGVGKELLADDRVRKAYLGEI
ncbi:ABC transporter ATP-binding protein [Treponema zuelzerae]|uniref:ABC transporter ATP-binding protein n=1 Tax=Teretinema zuelzerae TaxID=156 RepID=A0AAE3JM08_9SPIR|nr:ABC transporter ATP-binding protein [Teretinema zuelzerae]MCD1655289.1 ABC transporter ATP-binding protein [Teretinema zuelzerae]